MKAGVIRSSLHFSCLTHQDVLYFVLGWAMRFPLHHQYLNTSRHAIFRLRMMQETGNDFDMEGVALICHSRAMNTTLTELYLAGENAN